MYYACMPNVQIRNVSDDVHALLQRKAELAGQSLQQFLHAQLAALAATPTLEELVVRITSRDLGRVSTASAVSALDDERAGR
jgi:antitoxin FitA